MRNWVSIGQYRSLKEKEKEKGHIHPSAPPAVYYYLLLLESNNLANFRALKPILRHGLNRIGRLDTILRTVIPPFEGPSEAGDFHEQEPV